MNDLISRQSAYATALAMYVRCDTGDIEDYRDLMCESILVLPSADLKSAYEDGYEKGFADGFEAGQRDVQPERKKGKWITTRTWEHDGEIYCDQCGNDTPTEGDYRQVKTNFCPQCGADMRSKQND